MAAKIDTDLWLSQLRAVPKTVMELIFGRQREQLDKVAERWGFPINGSPCDLTAVLRRLSDFLKKYGPMLKVLMEDESGEGDENTLGIQYMRAKIEKTQQDALAQRLRNEQKQQRLCDLETVTQCLGLLCDRIVKAGERAQQRWGQSGLEFFQDLAAGFQTDLNGVFDAIGSDEAGDPNIANDSESVLLVAGSQGDSADTSVR